MNGHKLLRSRPIALCLKIDINNLAINSPPHVMLLAADHYEDFIDVERIAVTAILSFQSSGADYSEVDTP